MVFIYLKNVLITLHEFFLLCVFIYNIYNICNILVYSQNIKLHPNPFKI